MLRAQGVAACPLRARYPAGTRSFTALTDTVTPRTLAIPPYQARSQADSGREVSTLNPVSVD